MQLDRVARDIVLENVARAVGSTFQSLVTALRDLGRDVSLEEFLIEAEVEPERLYRNGRTWMSLRREAGLPALAPGPESETLGRGLMRIQHLDDPRWLTVLRVALQSRSGGNPSFSEQDMRALTGMAFTLFGQASPASIPEMLGRLSRNQDICAEALELVTLLERQAMRVTTPLEDVLSWEEPTPLSLHAQYSLDEVLAALGRSTLGARFRTQAGVLWVPSCPADIFFVTLEKDEAHYSPQTLYRDYAISPELFHWESQNSTRETGETGLRYINHVTRGTHILLFARQTRKRAGYTFLGPMEYQSHRGERPMAITWKLFRPMPADFFREARVAAG